LSVVGYKSSFAGATTGDSLFSARGLLCSTAFFIMLCINDYCSTDLSLALSFGFMTIFLGILETDFDFCGILIAAIGF